MKGLLHDTLRLVLSIGGLLLVLVLVVKLFSVYSQHQAYELARTTLTSIVEKSLLLSEGQEGTFPVRGPKGWYLMGWGTDVPPSQRPDRCYLESCLCICKGGGIGKKECQDLSTGICIDLPLISTLTVLTNRKEVTGYIPGDGGTGGVSVTLGKDEGIVFPHSDLEFPDKYIELKVRRTGTTLTFGAGG